MDAEYFPLGKRIPSSLILLSCGSILHKELLKTSFTP